MKLKNIKINYTMVPNQWFRSGLSLKAIGLITLLQSLPDNWDFSVAGLMTLTQDGKGSIQSALWELEEAGLIKRHQEQENGRFSHNVIELQIGRKTVDGKSADGKIADGKSATINKRQIKEKTNKEKNNRESVGTAKAAPTCTPEATRLAELLHQKILENKPTRKIGDKWKENWSVEIDRLHRIDKRDWKNIEKVIIWCQQDKFWWMNILSGETLRKQFDRLEDEMGAGKSKEIETLVIS